MGESFIAIDPGLKGGLAWYFAETDTTDHAPMPTTDDGVDAVALATLVRDLVAQSPRMRGIIEKVGGYVSGAPNTGSSMFVFGAAYGTVVGVLLAMGIPLMHVPAAKWTKYIGVGKKGERTTAQWKAHLRAEAQRLHPKLAVKNQTADALLILHYARMH